MSLFSPDLIEQELPPEDSNPLFWVVPPEWSEGMVQELNDEINKQIIENLKKQGWRIS